MESKKKTTQITEMEIIFEAARGGDWRRGRTE